MRKNLPVTQEIYAYPSNQTLISITDLKGRITYCNTDFISVSGYTEAELLGQPHNVLRHPDMPEEAFRDFWATIQEGKIWSQLIKNRRKDGDTYWVRANATPMRKGDKIIGYLSVRTLPSDDEIEQAESLFAIMRNEAKKKRLKHVFRNGIVKRRDFLGRIANVFRLGEQGRIALLILLAAAGPLTASFLGAPQWGQVLAGILCAILAWVGLIAISVRPVHNISKTAELLASGDLSDFVQIVGHGSMRRLLLPIGQMALATRTVMVDVRNDLVGLLDQTNNISHRSRELSSRTETQAASLVETAAAMDQISSTVQQTSDVTKTGVQIVRDATSAVQRSQGAVQDVSSLMREITDSSKSIGEFVQVIEAVAFQTNILALNAAVEAARAGEQGRGFAVVASEVRALSQRTTVAAKEIAGLIQESQRRVRDGSERADEAKSRMDDVVASVGRVNQILEEINHAAQEQSVGVQQINGALRQLEQITQQNAAMVEELGKVCKSPPPEPLGR